MKYKRGDRVKIKSLDWYNNNRDSSGQIVSAFFDMQRVRFCGTIQTIANDGQLLSTGVTVYPIEDACEYIGEEAIEGLAEETSQKDEFNKMYQEIVKQVEDKYKVKSEHPETEEEAKDFAAKVLKIKEEIPIPDNYEVWDDKGNVIHTSKIIIREKKKEYPKTYKECCKVLGIDSGCLLASYDIGLWKDELLGSLQKLLICRDAYWKVAGEEMGLGKPWEPSGNEYCFIISRSCGEVYLYSSAGDSEPFEFPTQEMRDAFKKNFDPDIEICKEFL